MSTIEKLPVNRPYTTIRTEDSADGAAHWLFMHADASTGIRPCCRKDMLDEMWSYMSAVTRGPASRHDGRLRHFVLASDATAYNLGGDLDLFTRLIRNTERRPDQAAMQLEQLFATMRTGGFFGVDLVAAGSQIVANKKVKAFVDGAQGLGIRIRDNAANHNRDMRQTCGPHQGECLANQRDMTA